ncbi:Ecdysteroid UDP-glucosyltransferase [Eumeta japonica]|uniref:Ecdysteroid UDP-glucosyltransferase n=1 Tax=Eumeta variegata TaxID=151549 RepID=A0A4C1SNU7_EUMVA|nr:Ecdysteroid UDP-glucosyltransferase [Eumeta japonica]
MHLHKFTFLLTILCLCHAAQGASILALFSSLSFADHYVYRGYVELLARNGHSVVVMTPYPGHFQYPEIEKIVELDVSQESAKYWDEYKKLMTNVDDYFPKMRKINELAVNVAVSQLRAQQPMAVFLNPNIGFDLVITEADVPLLYAVAEKYKAPHIAITAGSGSLMMYESKGTPNHPLYYPDLNTIFYEKLNIWEKLAEYVRYMRIRNEYYNNYLRLCQIAAEKLFGLKRDLVSVEQDIDLLFVSGTQTLIGNRPSSPAVIYTDRLHIKPALSLPQDLKAIMDGAENGCVYFSLGVVQEANQLSKTTIQMLMDAFGELPYLVFWKIEDVTAFKKPNNVITQNWFPQQEMLGE